MTDNLRESKKDISASHDEDTTNFDTVCSNNDSVLFESSENKTDIQKSESTCEYLERDASNKSDDPQIKIPLIGTKQVCIVPKKTIEEFDTKDISRNGVGHSIVYILRQPVFHLIAFTMCIYFLGVHSFFMVIVDFAKDKGIPESEGIYIISMFSITDLFGRAGLGWVTDRNYIKRKNMVALNLCVLGILYQLYPVIDSLSGILVVAAIHGLAVGSSITLFFVLQAECLGMKKLTLVVGLTSFINGIFSLLRPGINGLFRDVIGSYNLMFHFIGIISLVFSAIWLFESWKNKENKSRNYALEGKS